MVSAWQMQGIDKGLGKVPCDMYCRRTPYPVSSLLYCFAVQVLIKRSLSFFGLSSLSVPKREGASICLDRLLAVVQTGLAVYRFIGVWQQESSQRLQ